MILIDIREDSNLSRAVERHAKLANIKTQKQHLEVGDYVIGNICIEAKSVEDFLASVRNKRVFNQLGNIEDAYERPFLLVYGNLSTVGSYLNHTRTNIPGWREKLRKMFLGALSSIALNTKVKTNWLLDADSAAQFIVACAYHANKDLKLTKMLPKKTRTDDVRVDLLCCIRGVSETKARNLLEVHSSLLEISMQDVKTLSKVEGVGKATATNIMDALNNEEEVTY